MDGRTIARSLTTLAAVLMAAMTPTTALPASDTATVLQKRAAAARRSAEAPALGFVVQRRGGRAEIAVDGVRVTGEPAKVTPSDAWHWGSITKSMTATLVARLAEKGTVSWDDTVQQRLGGKVKDIPTSFRDVTFRHLLTHRAGLAANIPLPRFAEFAAPPKDPISDRLRWAEIALRQKPVGQKEETYLYSNNGYIVAGAMLEAVTGDSWEELLSREVFAPLGIKGAGFGAPDCGQPKGAPRGHRSGDENVAVSPGTDNPPALGPAGRAHMPLADIARYLRAHVDRPTEFLKQESWDTLHTPLFGGNYAMGWVAASRSSRWHNGSNSMWYAEASFDAGNGTVAAVVVNDGSIAEVQSAVRELLEQLMKDD